MRIVNRFSIGGAFGLATLALALAAAVTASGQSPPPSGDPAPVPAASLAPIVGPAASPTPTPKPKATPEPAENEGPIQTLTGTLGTRTDADGDREYVLNGIELSVGPPWFWGTKNPLEPFVGKTVTVTGRMDEGQPSAKAAGKPSDIDGPEFDAYTVNGTTVRAEGKPPWAGGPKVVGERHPGYKGWSQGKASGAKASTRP